MEKSGIHTLLISLCSSYTPEQALLVRTASGYTFFSLMRKARGTVWPDARCPGQARRPLSHSKLVKTLVKAHARAAPWAGYQLSRPAVAPNRVSLKVSVLRVTVFFQDFNVSIPLSRASCHTPPLPPPPHFIAFLCFVKGSLSVPLMPHSCRRGSTTHLPVRDRLPLPGNWLHCSSPTRAQARRWQGGGRARAATITSTKSGLVQQTVADPRRARVGAGAAPSGLARLHTHALICLYLNRYIDKKIDQ